MSSLDKTDPGKQWVEWYEQIRTSAINSRGEVPSNQLGIGVFINRGLGAWVKCIPSIDPSFGNSRRLPVKISNSATPISTEARTDLIHSIANIIFNQQRANYELRTK